MRVLRRTTTIPNAVSCVPNHGVTINEEDWERLETVLLNRIPQQLKIDIRDATESYLRLPLSEIEPSPIKPAVLRLRKISKHAQQFVDAINQGERSPAKSYADQLIAKYLAQINAPYRASDIAHLVVYVKAACDKASDEIASGKNPGPTEWQGWQRWMLRLTDILRKEGLPTAVRKDTAKSRSGKVSPFVFFLYELQKMIPERYRRAQHGLSALNEAIAKSRRVS